MKTPSKPPKGTASTPSSPSIGPGVARSGVSQPKASRISISAPSTPLRAPSTPKRLAEGKQITLTPKKGPDVAPAQSLFAKMRAAGVAKAVERRLGSGGGHIGDGLAQLTLDSGSKIDLDVFTASRTGSLNLLKQLVSTGQPVDVTDDTRRTPLHLASAGGHSDCVEYLLELKADFSARSRDNELTPLHEASTGETAELLLLARADVDAADAWGMTPLHLAAERGALEVVRCLLQYRADARRADGLGRTPLHLAAGRGRKAVVEELASHGADLEARDTAGRSALDHAAAHGYPEAAAALQEMAALLGAMGAGGTSLRALPAGSPARLTRGANDKPAPRPRTGSVGGREASPGPMGRAASPGPGHAGRDPAVQTLFLHD